MNSSELESWRQTRSQGKVRFLAKVVLHRCGWFSLPFAVTLLLTGLQTRQGTGFWSDYQFLIWIFAAVTLLIGFGDGIFLWNMRERDYLRKTQPENRSRSVSVRASNSDKELDPVIRRNFLN